MKDEYQGKVEYSCCEWVKGWACNPQNPKAVVELDVICDGQPYGRISCDVFRWDKLDANNGEGACGFVYQVPSELQDGVTRELRFLFTTTRDELPGSPVRIGSPTEYQAVPYECCSFLNHRVLFLSPHQDDESIGAGGSLYLHTGNDDPVKVVFLTDGSQGDFRQEYSTEDYVALRAQEATDACTLLGIDDIEFWGIADRKLQADQSTVSHLIGLLRSYSPTLIYAPSPLEWHPDHKAAAELLWRALSEAAEIHALVAFYEIYQPLRVNALVNVTDVMPVKTEACNTYKSQLVNAPHTELVSGMNRYRSMTVCNDADYVEAFYVMRSEMVAGREPWYFLREQLAPSFPRLSVNTPLVSIIVRTHNRQLLLADALSSIAMQRYPNIEAVVINDGGEDVSEVIEPYRKVLPITYCTLPERMGRSAAANKGLELAKGKYINLLDDDDVLYSEHVSRLVDFLETTSETSAYSDCEMGIYRWDASGNRSCVQMQEFAGINFDPQRLANENFIPSMAMMFHSDLVGKVGGFDTELEFLEDWDFWLRLTAHSMPSRLPVVSAQYRVFRQGAANMPGYDYQAWKKQVHAKHGHALRTAQPSAAAQTQS